MYGAQDEENNKSGVGHQEFEKPMAHDIEVKRNVQQTTRNLGLQLRWRRGGLMSPLGEPAPWKKVTQIAQRW